MRKALAVCLIISGLGMAFYGFSAFASAAVASDSLTVTFTVPSAEVLTVDQAALDFGEVTPGTTETHANLVTVTAQCNVSYDLTVSGTDFTDGFSTIPIGRLSHTESGTTVAFQTTAWTIEDNVVGQKSHTYAYNLTVDWTDPPSAAGQSYLSTITYTLTPN